MNVGIMAPCLLVCTGHGEVKVHDELELLVAALPQPADLVRHLERLQHLTVSILHLQIRFCFVNHYYIQPQV